MLESAPGGATSGVRGAGSLAFIQAVRCLDDKVQERLVPIFREGRKTMKPAFLLGQNWALKTDIIFLYPSCA
jgi:hypothetical protein